MKKILVLLLALVLILCAGCGKTDPAPAESVPETTEATVPETTVPETTEATIPQPQLVYGVAQTDGVAAMVETLSRGDQVDVVDSFDEDYYVVLRDWGYGLVEKALVRMEGDAPYESWSGYAASNTPVYDSFRMTGEPSAILGFNAKVEILEDLGTCYCIQTEDGIGYVAMDKLSKYSRSGGGYGGGYSGGGGGGAGMDGGDISLQFGGYAVRLAVVAPQQGDSSGKATVLADGTEVILGYFDRDEEIPIVAEDGFAEEREGMHTVYLNGLYAYVSKDLTHMEDEEAYEEWDGFSKYNAVVYKDRWLRTKLEVKMNMNTQIRVLYELENAYFVEVDGETGFMPKTDVSQYRYAGGGGGGGGYSGGGGGGGEWSPPVL